VFIWKAKAIMYNDIGLYRFPMYRKCQIFHSVMYSEKQDIDVILLLK
jgi:hypothetical protein